MAVASSVVTVTTFATALNSAGDAGAVVLAGASGNVTVGPSTVTATTGVILGTTSAPVVIPIKQGQVLYGIVATGTQTIQVLST